MTADNPYRLLPSVRQVISDPRLSDDEPSLVTKVTQQILSSSRNKISAGYTPPTYDQIVETIMSELESVLSPPLRHVINATGVIIHTNLGRSPISAEAANAMGDLSQRFSNLELDLHSGKRSSRHIHLEKLLTEVTGAEAGIAVNNGASAVLLALQSLASHREVIISRGEAIEIGDGLRIPDIMKQSGTEIVEVGTTNKTHLRDYSLAIGPDTAALFRIHPSNFKIIGFTQSPSISEMSQLAHEHGLLLFNDLGSGCLVDTAKFGLSPEPTVQESVMSGSDLTFFSGDKLIGGPQSGIIVGKRDLVEKIRTHPLARAVRIGKETIAGLSATLNHYLQNEATTKIPVWKMISMSYDDVAIRANTLAQNIGGNIGIEDGFSTIGGGSLPGEMLPTKLLSIPGATTDVSVLCNQLRLGTPSIIARVDKNKLLMDPRTIDTMDDDLFVKSVKAILNR